MVDKIEMSLDDIIKSTKGMGLRQRKPQGRAPLGRRGGGNFQQRGRGGGLSGGGGVRKGRNSGGGITRPTNGRFPRGDVNSAWKHDMFEGAKRKIRGIGSNTNTTAKLLVSNLDYGVSESDINELFADFGPLKSASVHYDRSGRSLGTADVVFERRADAVKAMKQYNGVPLDGRPMNIQLATSEVPTLSPAINRNRFPGPRVGAQKPQQRRNNAGGGGGGAPRRQGGRTPRGPAPTAEQLDAELDAYVKDMK
ncbi:THO complex subunit 4 [Lutzomyia longipalpis]|uniref:Putative rrm motif-containing protein n=1 Tax=Lutzomyia longipalpis TaxID=7200 RepID=A0A1B0CTC0_LUTLO|nr:THO complex subunit 4 [Lutzomyia longipalpis]